jgi:diguanylate cyclase (GGDEF)-like protein
MSTPDSPGSSASRFADLVHADKIHLLYRQSYQGVFSSIVAGALWVAIMWGAASRHALLTWSACLVACGALRVATFVAYRARCTPENAHYWIKPYAVTVLLSAFVLGVGTVWAMPRDVLVMQVMTYVFLVGLAGAALSAYGVFRGMTVGIVAAVMLPCTIYFFWLGEHATTLLAIAGVWFFLTTLRAITLHNQTVEESFRRSHELNEARQVAETQARTDALTGLANRRAFADAADALLKIAVREGRPASMLLIDIDDFKHINDHHGHATGDAALLHLARALKDVLRDSDVCGRLGGDEFAVLLPGTDLAAATDVARRLREILAARPLPVKDGMLISLSIGLAGDAFDTETLLSHADQAMYSAKRGGKDRIEVAR